MCMSSNEALRRSSFLFDFEETRHYVVCVNSLEQSIAIIMNEPTRHIFSFLHILSEISLQTPIDRKWHSVTSTSPRYDAVSQSTCSIRGQLYTTVSSGLNSPCNNKLVSFHEHDSILFALIFSWKQVTDLKLQPVIELSWISSKTWQNISEFAKRILWWGFKMVYRAVHEHCLIAGGCPGCRIQDSLGDTDGPSILCEGWSETWPSSSKSPLNCDLSLPADPYWRKKSKVFSWLLPHNDISKIS